MGLLLTSIFIGVLCILVYVIWVFYRHSSKRTEKFQRIDESTQAKAMENLGRMMLIEADVLPSRNQALNITDASTKEVIKTELTDQNARILLDKVISIMVGKYTLDDPHIVSYLREAITNVILYLCQNKSPEIVLTEYDPQFSNDLLLEACRDLYQYPSLDPMKKILVGQFIANKTMDGDEIDAVYNYITTLALNPLVSSIVRMNAADMLNLSNSRKHMANAKQALELLRQEDDQPRRSLARPGGGQDTLFINRDQAHPQPIHRPQPARIRGPNHETRGNDWPIIIPAVVGQQQVAEQQRRWVELARPAPKVERTVYEDGQNVHNTEINNSVLEAAKELVSKYRSTTGVLNLDNSIIEKLPDNKRIKINASIHRITTDPSTFKHGTTLYSIYQALLHYIDQSPYKDELNKRLIEELTEMSSLCATGHLARMMNVLQGFDETKKMDIKMNIDEEVYNKVAYIIQNAITGANNSDELLEDFESINKKLLIPFFQMTMTNELDNISKEYENVTDKTTIITSVKKALDKYTRTSGKFNSLK
jgi:predicted house-cleaning noncanonical NTP pyrophosphatase (MazG superfamily)